ALANEIEGTVGVLLTVTTAGRVGACSVSQSSGAAVLDEAACTAFTRYAVFEPALASDGQPIAGRWRSQVSYRLPSSTAAMTPPTPTAPPTPMPRPTPIRPDRSREVEPIDEAQWMRRVAASYPSRAIANEIEGTVVVVLTVNSVGRVAFCKVTQSSGADVLDEAACSGFRRYAVFEPALRSDGKPVAGRWRTQVSYRLQ
ncbi:MAG: TonB family protein, partial [Pseudomonadota bacterium]